MLSQWSVKVAGDRLDAPEVLDGVTSNTTSLSYVGTSEDIFNLLPPGLRRVYKAVVEDHAFTLKLVAEKIGYAESTVYEYLGKLRKIGVDRGCRSIQRR